MVDEFYLLSVYVWMNEKAFAAFCIAVKVVCEIRVQQKSSELIFFVRVRLLFYVTASTTLELPRSNALTMH